MKKLMPLILSGVLLSSFLSGCSSVASARPMPPEDMKMGEMMEDAATAATAVETISIFKTSITNTLTYSGTAEYVANYSIVPEVSGKVNMLFFEVGDTVNEGDILFEIDDKEIQNNIQQLNASLASANATVQQQQTRLEQLDGSSKETQIMNLNTNISNAEKSVENAKIALANAESALVQAQSNMNTAKQNYDDTQRLYDVKAVSQSDLDNAKTAYETAVSSYEGSERSVEQSRLSLEQSEDQLENAEKTYEITLSQSMEEEKKSGQDSLNSAIASRNTISVQLQQANEKLEYVKVKSPVSGIVSQKNIELGATVSTAATAYTIVDDSKVSIKTNVTEQLVGGLAVGDSVSVTINTLSNEPLAGVITSISPLTDNSGTYPISVEVDNTGKNVKSGMFAEITFDKEKSSDAYVITKDAVLTDETGSYVYIVVDGCARRTDVTTGIDNGKDIEITDGLKDGDIVIVKGQNQVSDGSMVQSTENNDK